MKKNTQAVSSYPVYEPIECALTTATQIRNFKKEHRGCEVRDCYRDQLEDLFLLRNPRFRFDKNYGSEFEKFIQDHTHGDASMISAGKWFFYPWINALVHVLPHAEYTEMRTGRNRYLITQEEQDVFYNAVIGIDGMSVGSHVALTVALTGGARHIKIADLDTLSGSNLNRIRTGVVNLGIPKAVLVARSIYEMNPYAIVDVFSDGITPENCEKFIAHPQLDLLIEEADNPYIKLRLRELAKTHKIPVIMAADNGDGVIVDVERFDKEPKRAILHGIMGKMTAEALKEVSPQDLPKIIAKMAGADIAHLRMIESVGHVGRTIYSWPQLGTAATMCGTILSYLARQIVTKNNKIKSGRYEVNPDAIFEYGYNNPAVAKFRNNHRLRLLKKLGK